MNDQQPSNELISFIFENLDDNILTSWEVDFVRSIHSYWLRTKKLSPKQSKRLVEIWEDRTNIKRLSKSNARK